MKQRGAEALFRYREHWEELTFKLDQIRKQNSAAIGRSTLKALVRTESTGTFLSRLGSLLSLSDESRSRLAEEHRTLHQLRDAAIEQVSVGSVTWLSAQREEVSKFEALKEDVKSLLKDGDSRYFRAAWALYPTLYRKQIDRFIAGAWTLAYGKSHERYRCAYRIRSLLRTSNLSCDESFSRDIADRLLGLVKWLFLDDNTGVWKLGAECLGLLALGEDNDAFAYLNDAITRSKGSTEGQAKLRLERHGFAALGWAALHNPGFVREKVDSLLPRADESKKTFNRRRRNAGVGEDPFIVASFAFSIPGAYVTLPQAALDWFTTLSKYDMQKDHELATHDNLSVVACEMLFEHLPHSSIEQRKIWLDAIHRWLSRFAAVPNRSESAWELFEQLTRINRQRIDLIRIGLNRLELTVIDRTAGHVDDLSRAADFADRQFERFGKHVVGVSTKRLVRLSLSVGRGSTQSAGLVDLRHAGSGAPHDALDVDELEGNDRKLPWMDLVGPPGETIEDFYDWIRTSLLRWYGWDRHTRFIAFDSLRLSSRQFDGEQCDFTGPAFESARVYLQLCCFVAANCCKRLEGNKAFTYEIPEFDPQTLFVITGTVATPMPDRNPLSWPIERVARFGDKLTVLEEAARTYRQVIFVAPEANRSEVESSIQGLGSVGRAKVEPVYVETFSEVLNALGFRRRDTRFDSQEALHEFHASLDDIHKTLTDWSKPTYVERVHALAQLANGVSRFLDTAELVSATGDLDQPKPEFDQDDRVMTDVALSSSNLIFSLLEDIDDKEISRKSEHKLYQVRGVRLLADILDALPVERDQVPLIQRVLRFIDPTDSSITVSHWMKPLAVTVERTIVRAWYCNDRNTAERQLVRLREIIEQWISSCYDGNPKGGDPDEFRNELFRRVRAVARDPHLVARFTGVLPDR